MGMRGEVDLGGMGGVCAVRDGGDDLPEVFGADISCGKDARDVGGGGFVGDDIAMFVKSDRTCKELCGGDAANADEDAVTGNVGLGAVLLVLQSGADDLFLHQKAGHGAVPDKCHIRGGKQGFAGDLCGAQGIAAVDEDDLFGQVRQIQRVLHGGVAAADDQHRFSLIKPAVAVGAITQAAADKRVFSLDAEFARVGPRGDDHRAGRQYAGRCHDLFDFARKVDCRHLFVLCFGAESLGARLHFHAQREAVDARVKAGIVVYRAGERHLAAGRQLFDHQRVKPCPCAVERGCVPGGASADDDHIKCVLHKASPLFWVLE